MKLQSIIVSILKWIFQIKHFIYAAVAGASVYHMHSVEKDHLYIIDHLLFQMAFYTVPILLIRKIRSFVIRLILAASIVGSLMYLQLPDKPILWSTHVWICLVLLY